MNDKVIIGKQIQKIRLQNSLTRKELSLLSSIHYTSIMNIENGKTNPKLDTLLKLSKYLQVHIKDLLTYEIE
jgi:transcriptional regulator with XRE-family HTH domain